MADYQPPHRFRITFSKRDSLRFVGHLDLAKTWERVLRRAGMPLVYSQGFNPQPKMQLASALPLGVSSECELLDIWLTDPVDEAALPERLNEVSPPGLRSLEARLVPLKGPALQTMLESAEYRIVLDEVTPDELAARVKVLLAQAHIERERRGKIYDLRPLILSLEAAEDGVCFARLALGQQGSARPDELVAALGLDPKQARYHRMALNLRDE
jgi:radical SAM-linked protein